MKIPKRLEPLLEDGLIDDVIQPLRSGKEAQIYVVDAYGDICCAKIYKEKNKRNFHNQVLYQEGRNRRNSRSARALGKHTKYGKKVEEEEWQHTEIDTLFKLHAAHVCVPVPHICMSGVLLMELVLDSDGNVAPQIGDLHFDTEEALYCHDFLLREVIRMLLAGIVHADLSEYNVVMSYNGPVIIDFPQAVDATSNNNAQYFLERDVRNLTHFFGRFAPELLQGNYGLEIWQHYCAETLSPEMELTGKPEISSDEVDIDSVMTEIDEAREEAELKRMRLLGIEPEEDIAEWYEPKRKVRKYTKPKKKPAQTSGSEGSSKGNKGNQQRTGSHQKKRSQSRSLDESVKRSSADPAPDSRVIKQSDFPAVKLPDEPIQWGR